MKGVSRGLVVIAMVLALITAFLGYQAVQTVVDRAEDVNTDSRGNAGDNVTLAACLADCTEKYPSGSSTLQLCQSRCRN